MTGPLIRSAGSDTSPEEETPPRTRTPLRSDLSDPFPCNVNGCEVIHIMESFTMLFQRLRHRLDRNLVLNCEIVHLDLDRDRDRRRGHRRHQQSGDRLCA